MTELQYTGERAVPWNPCTGAHILNRHVMRYAWAVPWTYGKTVVDLGCGTGYGSFILSWGARRVLGLDMSREAVHFGQGRFEAQNLEYRVQDITADKLPGAEAYVAFEFLEHLDDPKAVIARLHGSLLWSLPVNNESRFHRRAYSLAEAEALVPGSEIWYQDSVGTIVPRRRAWFQPSNVIGAATL